MKEQIKILKEKFGADRAEGLRFASKLNCLGRHRDVIQRGWAARSNPDFYRQLGKDPERLEADAYEAIGALVSDDPAA